MKLPFLVSKGMDMCGIIACWANSAQWLLLHAFFDLIDVSASHAGRALSALSLLL